MKIVLQKYTHKPFNISKKKTVSVNFGCHQSDRSHSETVCMTIYDAQNGVIKIGDFESTPKKNEKKTLKLKETCSIRVNVNEVPIQIADKYTH